MKSRRTFYVFFLCGFLCALTALSVRSRGAIPPAPAQQSGSAASGSPQSAVPEDSSSPEEVAIPGPLRSFLRMAAISQKITPEEVLPLLARNVVMSGYQGGRPTEFLVLVNWYMDQARELEALAGKGEVIHVSNCDDAKRLLVILGYRLQQSCGPDAALETADANRAFLTIDSGFPLADLEEALREGKPFETPYAPQKFPSSTSRRIGCRTRKMPTAESWTRSCAIPTWPACIGRCRAWIPKRVNSCGNLWDPRN